MASKRLYGPAQLTNAAADLYTVPAGRKALVRHIHVSNPSGGAVGFTLSVGADAAGVRLFDNKQIAAGDVLDFYCYLPMAAAEKFQGLGSTTLVLVIEISGDEDVA